MSTMITKIEVLGEITASERARLHEIVRSKDITEFIPGDGVLLAQEDDKPPKFAYLNRRLYLHTAEATVKLVFEVSGVRKTPLVIDKQKLALELMEFVARKSAVFSRPDLAAQQLTKFFVEFMGG